MRVSQTERGAALRRTRPGEGLLMQAECSRRAGKRAGGCWAGLCKPMQALQGGVKSHSVRAFAAEVKRRTPIIEHADAHPLALLTKSRKLHGELAGRAFPGQGGKGKF